MPRFFDEDVRYDVCVIITLPLQRIWWEVEEEGSIDRLGDALNACGGIHGIEVNAWHARRF